MYIAIAPINKWIKTVANSDAGIHGLRHSIRDRVRAVEALSEVITRWWSLKNGSTPL
jgi:hypothetical protein